MFESSLRGRLWGLDALKPFLLLPHTELGLGTGVSSCVWHLVG